MIEEMLTREHGKLPINGPRDVLKFCQELAGSKKEAFVVFLLDSANGVIASEIVAVGTLNSAIIHPREVFKLAVTRSANAVILVHNHPSGNLEPSDEDRDVTRRLAEAGEVLGIKLLDHLIVSEDVERYRSIDL